MSRDQDLERNERATPYKLQEAHKRGSTARSVDATALAVLLVGVIACFAMGGQALQRMAALLAGGLAAPLVSADGAVSSAAHAGSLLAQAIGALAPLLFAVVVAVISSGLLQSGAVFSTTPLKPDFQRLNPIHGFKRLLSLRLLYEAGKSALKLLALATVAGLTLHALLVPAAKLTTLPPKALGFVLLDAAGGLGAKLCAVLALFVIVDLVFVRWDFMRTMRMSRRELEDEHKHREGDPRITNRQRELRLQFLQRTRSVSRVPGASLVIVNPTHLAVALKYEHGKTPAPQLVAKGAGALAERIRMKAHRAGVPIVHSPILARALFKEVAQEGYVPEQWYPQVARILVWLQAAKAMRAPAGAAA